MSTDPRIDAYIADAAPFARPILQHLRFLVHRAVPEVVETLKWSAPSFTLDGSILCGMAAFKAHCTFGFWHQGMEAVLGADGAKAGDAMGSLGRITSLADLPSPAKLTRYLKAAAKLASSGAPGRPAPKVRRPTLPMPADLSTALAQPAHAKAAATFAAFSPSHRRDYIEWITEAKRPATRAQRLATTLEWLTAGKRRNWKYEAC